MKTSSTGRIIDYQSFPRQEKIAMRWHRRMTQLLDSAPDVKKVGSDFYDMTNADYVSLELRIMAAMSDET